MSHKAHNKASNLVWIDLEMTGLDPAKDVILEIATIVTDVQLNIVAQGPSFIINQPDEALDGMIEYVKQMHAKSGLTQAVRASNVSLRQAEQLTLEFIKQHCKAGESPLCGNTIWSDRLFLAHYMPQLTQYVHYRLIDVSSIKEVILRWYPAVDGSYFKKSNTHRALDDIKESIEELKFYKEHFFI